MALNFEEREREGILTLSLAGHLTMGPEDVAFRNLLDHCIAAGKIKIVLDCRRLGNLDSVGLGTLVYYETKLERAGGKVVLLHVARAHMELLVRTKLDAIFEVFDDEQEAVNGFFPERASRRFDVLEFVEEQTVSRRPAGKIPKHSPDNLVIGILRVLCQVFYT